LKLNYKQPERYNLLGGTASLAFLPIVDLFLLLEPV